MVEKFTTVLEKLQQVLGGFFLTHTVYYLIHCWSWRCTFPVTYKSVCSSSLVCELFCFVWQMSGMELRVGNKYRLGRKIGSGSFGDIYLGNYNNWKLLKSVVLKVVNRKSVNWSSVFKPMIGYHCQ